MKQKKQETAVAVSVGPNGFGYPAAVLADTDIPSIVDSVASDLTQAEIGTFCKLRAGVGLTCIKQLCDHTTWESRMIELFPNRSPRTLQRYMQEAREFMQEHAVLPEQAWGELCKYDTTQVSTLMIAAPAPMALGTGEPEQAEPARKGRKAKAAPAPVPETSEQTFSQMLIDFIQQRKKAKAKDQTPPRTLTKKEKIETAISEANRIVNVTADWLSDGTWALLPDEELESTMAGLRAAADKLRMEFKNRTSKI